MVRSAYEDASMTLQGWVRWTGSIYLPLLQRSHDMVHGKAEATLTFNGHACRSLHDGQT